jgi:hypothetical protein
MQISCTITGLGKQKQVLLETCSKENAMKFMETLVEETAKLMRTIAPRNTGWLESHIVVTQVSANTFKLELETPYAYFTEYGTRYIDIGTVEAPMYVVSMSGKRSYRPYARVAVWSMLNEFQATFDKVYSAKIR